MRAAEALDEVTVLGVDEDDVLVPDRVSRSFLEDVFELVVPSRANIIVVAVFEHGGSVLGLLGDELSAGKLVGGERLR
jgi:hypothetical protein